MWITPIYDRTESDVSEIKNNPFSENTKGAFNYFDLNRIENNIQYLCDLFYQIYNFYPDLLIRTDWEKNEVPTLYQINRIRNNIVYLQLEIDFGEEYKEIEFSQYMDYKKANILEKNIELIKLKYEEFLTSGVPVDGDNLLDSELSAPFVE